MDCDKDTKFTVEFFLCILSLLRPVSPINLAIKVHKINTRLLGLLNLGLRKYQIVSLKITLFKTSNKSTCKGGKNKKAGGDLLGLTSDFELPTSDYWVIGGSAVHGRRSTAAPAWGLCLGFGRQGLGSFLVNSRWSMVHGRSGIGHRCSCSPPACR